MHYTRTTFTKNGQNTLESITDSNQKLGGLRLSKYDIKKLNSMYYCNCKFNIYYSSSFTLFCSCLPRNLEKGRSNPGLLCRLKLVLFIDLLGESVVELVTEEI